MAEYIKKALVAREIRKLLRVRESPVDIFQAGFEYGVDKAWANINKIPAADVAPVVHGRWVYNPNGMDWNLGAWQCSVCKCNNNNLPGNDKYNPYIFQGSNYCPNCGAKMDEEVVK